MNQVTYWRLLTLFLFIGMVFSNMLTGWLATTQGHALGFQQGQEKLSKEMAHAVCGALAIERDYTHFYVENGKCWGEFRHPINQKLLKTELTVYNKTQADQELDDFITSRLP